MILKKVVQAAQALYNKYETAVLCKGGHSIEDANDYLYGADGGNWLESKRIDNENTHGTGCTLSSAIASYLAQNCELTDAVIKAKEYISGALADGMDLGQGSGPLNHAFRFNPSKNWKEYIDMLSEKMVQLGTNRSVIRDLFEYGNKRKAEL